jgi:AraC-like DNA-binding protein/mannose-6-phosphate isomerase-like protein (cupin superfamily)
MIAFAPHSSGEKSSTRKLFSETFRKQIAALERDRLNWHVPVCSALFETLPGMQYHFKPELFVQLGGSTEFALPGKTFSLEPGQVCIMPKGVPHGEVARDGVKSFENIVVCYYNETVAIHVAHATANRRPVVDDICFFSSEYFTDLVEYLNRISELRSRTTEAAAKAIKGLLLAEFSLLQAIVEAEDAAFFSDSDKVFRCQWLIRNNLQDPQLGVDSIAAELRCSPNYLSKLFHRQVGERVVEYINRIRMQNAIEALRQTPLSVKEIASACGFNDPNYFARVFRKTTGQSPGDLRKHQHQLANVMESDPKVVFSDRVERNFGLRPEVMAKAEVRVTS